ncbi:ATP-dependent RNA helicase SrmB [Sodalis praecaptivus]
MHKSALLCHLLKQPDVSKSIVFVHKRERLHELVGWLRDAGITPCYLEGELVQAKRNEAIKRMTDGRTNVLVATDVAARGLDIDDISHVINFDLPSTPDVYLHRIGRTARAGRKGCAISLVEAHDHLLLGKISRYLNEPLKARTINALRPATRAPSEKMTGKPSKKVLAKRKEKKEQARTKDKTKVRLRAKRTSANAACRKRRRTRPATASRKTALKSP